MSFIYVQYTVDILKNIWRCEASRVVLCLIFMIKKVFKAYNLFTTFSSHLLLCFISLGSKIVNAFDLDIFTQ